MSRLLTFTRYPHALANNNGQVITRPWNEWLLLFGRHLLRGTVADQTSEDTLNKAKNGPCLVLGEIPPDKGRKDINVRFIDALALDLEHMDADQLGAVLDIIAPFTFAAWTTHKSGAEAINYETRLRIILPLSRSLSPSEFAGAWAGMNRLIGNKNDVTTKNISRLNYLPSTFDQSLAYAWNNEGRWLDMSDLPDVEKSRIYSDTKESVGVDRYLVMRMKDWLNKGRDLPPPARALGSGKVLADVGSGLRHEHILYLTMRLAGQYPNANEDTIAALFEPSIDAMLAEDPAFEGMPSVIEAFNGALEHAEKKQEIEQATQEEQRRQEQLEGEEPYTDNELNAMADKLKCTRDKLKQRWILLHDQYIWFLLAGGKYHGPIKRTDAEVAVMQALKRAPVKLVDATKEGFKYRPFLDVMREHATTATGVSPSLAAQEHSYDATSGIIIEATCPLRSLAPTRDETIQRWLLTLGGANGEKVIDWVSCVSQLDRLLCSIYFDGPAGAGKTLLAHGLSSLWVPESQPTDAGALINGFNDQIQKCPLIFGDEDLPKPRDRSNITGVLRAHLSTQSRTLSRKFRDTARLMGSIRLILAANNESLLQTEDVATAADLEAIAQRFMYIKADDAAVQFLNALPRDTKDYWMREGIAKHALWLRDNHTIANPGRRFWVEGDVSLMHRILMTGSRWNSRVCEMLVKYLINPKMGDQKSAGLVRRGGKELLVNTQFMSDNWQGYLGDTERPDTAKISAATRAVAKSTRRITKRFKGDDVHYYEIDIDHLLAWSDRNNIGSRDRILSAIGYAAARSTHTDDLDSIPSINDEEGYPL